MSGTSGSGEFGAHGLRLRPSGNGLRPGDCILNTYRIERLISTGGMGALYAGRHEIMGDPVAIKVVRSEFVRDELAVRLFQREAAMLKQVRHDAVVRYEAFLREAHGGLVLVMEYVDGLPLSTRLKSGRLALDQVLVLGERLASGLQAAHDVGIAHRDLSPDNILLPSGRIDQAKIIDFGIAKQLGNEESTILGQGFAGKIRYASPEQLGLFDGMIDGRSDIYSLALILAEAAGLRIPGGDSIASAIEVRSRDAELPADLDPRLLRRLTPMLCADPACRPSSVLSAWNLPYPVEAGGDDGAETDRDADKGSLATHAVAGARKWRQMAAAALLCLCVVAGGTGLALYGFPEQEEITEILDPRDLAKEILKLPGDDALARADTLISDGGKDNLNAALGVLLTLAKNGNSEAALMLAKMYDPSGHSPDSSPVSPNPKVAVQWYQRAADAGVGQARERLHELGSK